MRHKFWGTIGPNRRFLVLRNMGVYAKSGPPTDGGHITKGMIVIDKGSWKKQYPEDSLRRLLLPNGRIVMQRGLNPHDRPGGNFELLPKYEEEL